MKHLLCVPKEVVVEMRKFRQQHPENFNLLHEGKTQSSPNRDSELDSSLSALRLTNSDQPIENSTAFIACYFFKKADVILKFNLS